MEKVDKEHGHGGIILMEDLSKRGSSLDVSLGLVSSSPPLIEITLSDQVIGSDGPQARS